MNIASLLQSERAFTLIEMLLVLSILLLLLAFFPSLMSVVVTGHQLKDQSSQDMTIFFNHLARDVKEAREIETGYDFIQIEKGDGDRYVIERISSNKLRRQRNYAGHVLLLEDVRSFQCTPLHQLIQCEVVRLNGMKMTRSIPYLYPYEEEEDLE